MRNLLLKIHLYFSAFFAPMILLMAFTGTSYLFGNKGTFTATDIKVVPIVSLIDENFVRTELKLIDPNYDFEYLKESGQKIMTRPTTRTYYQFVKEDSVVKIQKVVPDLLGSLVEVHKGHGPGLVKTFEKIFGFSLIIILITGVWIGLLTKRDKGITLYVTLSGLVFTIFLLTMF